MSDPKCRVVQPVAITNGGTLISSTASSAGDPAAYAGGTTYAAAARVTYGDSIYESLQASNTGHQPDLTASATWWAFVQPINKMCMFDASVSTQTTNADSIVVVIKPGQTIDTLDLRNLDGSSVIVTQTDPTDGVVYTETQTLTVPITTPYGSGAYWDYFFTSPRRKSYALFTGFLPYSQATITVTITKTGSTAKCGLLVCGNSFKVNAGMYGATDSITDFSIIQTDSFGVRDIVLRDYADDAEFQIQVETATSPYFRDFLASVRATPMLLLISDSGRPDAAYYGLISFRRTFSFPTFDLFALQIKGYT
jgi:hypothetical protein